MTTGWCSPQSTPFGCLFLPFPDLFGVGFDLEAGFLSIMFRKKDLYILT